MLCGATTGRPTLYKAARAAVDGDFNPSDLFGSLLSYHDTLELGRHSRGHDARLDMAATREMKRMIAVRDRFGAKHPRERPFDEEAAALVITQAGYELFSRER